MPIYEYEVEGGECHLCGGCFELRRPADREPLTDCPVCRKPVHKLISRANSLKSSPASMVSDAKNAGFTVLQRRDKGVYEKR
jgi:putative FmdB family regulatory protein